MIESIDTTIKLAIRRFKGDVPEWLLARFAKQLFVGSIPTVTSNFLEALVAD